MTGFLSYAGPPLVMKIEKEITMWGSISSIAIISCFLINCYSSKSAKKIIVYPDRIEMENYIIHKDATELPSWSNYYESMIRYEESDGSIFGPSLERYGWGPWSSDGKGIYLDILPNSEYVLLFADTKDNREDTKWRGISVKGRTLSQTVELLISKEDINQMLPGGIHRVYGFENEELILKTYYFIYKMD